MLLLHGWPGGRSDFRTHLEHFWHHRSGPTYSPEDVDRLADSYARPLRTARGPGALAAAIREALR